jgi:hypothetical protein
MPRKHYDKGKLGSKLPNELQYKQGCHEKIRQTRKEMEVFPAPASP